LDQGRSKPVVHYTKADRARDWQILHDEITRVLCQDEIIDELQRDFFPRGFAI